MGFRLNVSAFVLTLSRAKAHQDGSLGYKCLAIEARLNVDCNSRRKLPPIKSINMLEAKSLAAVVLQSFEDARKLKGQDQKYQDALAKNKPREGKG